MSAPVQAHAAAGFVFLKLTPATARDIAEAFSAAYAGCSDLEQDRTRWMDDVVTILDSAARADVQNGDGPGVVRVPLRLVGGTAS